MIGLTPQPPEPLAQTKAPYRFVGSPVRDRVDRVQVTSQALGLGKQPILAILPGNSPKEFRDLMPMMQAVAEEVVQSVGNITVVVSLSDQVYQDASDKSIKILPNVTVQNPGELNETIACGKLQLMRGMGLELMSLATMVLTGCGASSMEAALLKKPVLSFYPGSKAKSSGLRSLANQIAQKQIHPELATQEPLDTVVDQVVSVFKDSEHKENLIREVSVLRSIFDRIAAENAASVIGGDIAAWSVKKKIKGALPA